MSSDYLKVKDHDDLVRDKRTGAILSTSSSDYEAAKNRKRITREREFQNKSQNNEIIQLRSEIEQLKDLVHQMLQKRT